jgi:hypothetical protein
VLEEKARFEALSKEE